MTFQTMHLCLSEDQDAKDIVGLNKSSIIIIIIIMSVFLERFSM